MIGKTRSGCQFFLFLYLSAQNPNRLLALAARTPGQMSQGNISLRLSEIEHYALQDR